MTNEELVNQIQQGINSCECLEQLYTQNKGLINKIVKKFEYVYHVNNSKTSIPLIEYQELMDEAYFGLLEAVNRYEDTAGVKFMTYAPFWIRQSIQNYIRNNINSIRIPRHLYEKITVYKKVVGAYEAQLYRKPSDKELCRALGIEIKALNELKKVIYNCNMIDSLDREISDEDDTILCDTISGDADVENIVIDDMMDKSLKTELWQIV
jgi:RNA polymerase primary sigma factor